MAWVWGIVNVSVVIRATPMVAVRPGRAPMTMPRKVAQSTVNSTPGDMKPANALPKFARLSSIGESRLDHGRRT